MFTRPADVADADLTSTLGDGWGIDVASLDYLAVGFGSHHWRVITTDRVTWFVTVDDLVAKRRESDEPLELTRTRLVAALATAGELREAGYGFVVAPERSADGAVARNLGDRYVVAVYPLVNGNAHDYGPYVDASHRDAVVRHLAALHGSPAECRRWAHTETFSIARRSDLFAACTDVDEAWESGPFAEQARLLLARHAAAVAAAFATYDALVTEVSSEPQRFVLTHGEPHPANTITTDQGVVIVDWDTTLIAPPERDLWYLTGEEPSVAAQYEALTGTALSRDAVELYRLAWDLSDIALYISDFRRTHERTDDMSEAWQNLQHYLDPKRW